MSRCERSPCFCGDMGAAGLATTSKDALSHKCEEVEQIFQQVAKYEKLKTLTKLVKENDGKRVLVFVKTKRNADFIAVMLSEQQMLTSSIHGARVQRDRKLARENFKSGHHNILVATSAAVCGPDIKNVDIVVNYDLPQTIDEYVQRIGRAGCVGHKGKAVSFFNADQDARVVADLVKNLRQADQPLPDFFQVRGTATYQDNDTVAMTSELSTPPRLLRSLEASSLTNNGKQELLMTPRGPLMYWCCFRSECLTYCV